MSLKLIQMPVAFLLVLGCSVFSLFAGSPSPVLVESATATLKKSERVSTARKAAKTLLNTSSRGLKTKTTTSGAKIVSLQGRLRSVVIAELDHNGKINITCISADQTAAKN